MLYVALILKGSRLCIIALFSLFINDLHFMLTTVLLSTGPPSLSRLNNGPQLEPC